MPIPQGLKKPEHNLAYYIIDLSQDKIKAAEMAKSILQSLDIKLK